MMFPRKPVYVTLLLAVLGIGACTVPTETEVEMGQRLTYTLDSGGLLDELQQVTRFVEAQPGVDDVSVAIQETDDGPTTIDLMIWGRGIDGDDLAGRLAGVFPALAGAHLERQELTTGIRTSLAEKLGHDLFHIEVVAEGTDDEIRARILQQIYESGFAGDAQVDVSTEDGVTTIGVEMTHEGDGVETEDELVIEVIREDE
ncbi:hypothetical protein KKG45_11520 [bacterium]|nr:hypothetical protein [bacterium]MBU1073864.1 hypothetical protein [bacterium]